MKRRSALALGLGMLTLPLLSRADTWPSRPIRLIVASAAGGAADTFGRAMASQLAKALGQPVVVENRAGANGRIGTEATLNAAPDGYTLLLSYASAIAGIKALFPNDRNDGTRLQPIARFGSAGAIFTTSARVPATNLQEFLAWAKASKTEIAYATYGVGSGAHVVAEALSHALGIKMNHIPYKESVKVLNDMQGGLLDVAFLDAVTPLPFIKQGSLRAIAVNGKYRMPALPDVATMEEQGVPIFLESWYGFFAPPGTDPKIVGRLNTEINTIASSNELAARFRQLNLAQSPALTVEAFGRYIDSEVQAWTQVVQENDIRPE